MKRTSAILFCAVLLLAWAAPPAHAKGSKATVLKRIEKLLQEGDMDQAKRMIDFFLGKNPGDPDLLRLLDRWRVRKGDLGPILSGKDLADPRHRTELRRAAWRIVVATAPGNPDEWPALLDAGRSERVEKLLTQRRTQGDAEEQRMARKLLEEMSGQASPKAPRSLDDLRAALKTSSRDEQVAALREAERRGLSALKPEAKKIYENAKDPELRFAAAGLLLAVGDRSIRPSVEKAARSGDAYREVEALKVLLRHPGPGRTPIQDRIRSMEKDDSIGLAKHTMLSLAIAALGTAREPGALKFLESRLTNPTERVDATRALGALGDPAAVPALLHELRSPPKGDDAASGGGLGFLAKSEGARKAAQAEDVRPDLVAAIAILRVTSRGSKGR